MSAHAEILRRLEADVLLLKHLLRDPDGTRHELRSLLDRLAHTDLTENFLRSLLSDPADVAPAKAAILVRFADRPFEPGTSVVGQVWLPVTLTKRLNSQLLHDIVIPRVIGCTVLSQGTTPLTTEVTAPWSSSLRDVIQVVAKHGGLWLFRRAAQDWYSARVQVELLRRVNGGQQDRSALSIHSEDHSFELATAVALLSSAFQVPLQAATAAIGTVSSTGEIKAFTSEIFRQKCEGLRESLPRLQRVYLANDNKKLAEDILEGVSIVAAPNISILAARLTADGRNFAGARARWIPGSASDTARDSLVAAREVVDYALARETPDHAARLTADELPRVSRHESELTKYYEESVLQSLIRRSRRRRLRNRGLVALAVVVATTLGSVLLSHERRVLDQKQQEIRAHRGARYESLARANEARGEHDIAQIYAAEAIKLGSTSVLGIALPAILSTPGFTMRRLIGLPAEPVTAIAVDARGERVAATSLSGSVIVFDAATGRPIATTKLPWGGKALAFRGDDLVVVTEAYREGDTIWNLHLNQGGFAAAEKAGIRPNFGVEALSQDGRIAAAREKIEFDGSIPVCDFGAGSEEGRKDRVTRAPLERECSARADKKVREIKRLENFVPRRKIAIWDLVNRQVLGEIDPLSSLPDGFDPRGILLSTNGRRLMVASVKESERRRRPPPRDTWYLPLMESDKVEEVDVQMYAASSADTVVMRHGNFQLPWTDSGSFVATLSADDSTGFVAVGASGFVTRFDGKEGLGSEFVGISLKEGGKARCAADESGDEVYCISNRTLERESTRRHSSSPRGFREELPVELSSVAVDTAKKRVYAGDVEGTIRAYETGEHAPAVRRIADLDAGNIDASAAVLEKSGGGVVYSIPGDMDGKWFEWNGRNRTIDVPRGDACEVVAVWGSIPRGAVALACKNYLRLWDTEKGERWRASRNQVEGASFSGDGTRLLIVSGYEKRQATIFDVVSGRAASEINAGTGVAGGYLVGTRDAVVFSRDLGLFSWNDGALRTIRSPGAIEAFHDTDDGLRAGLVEAGEKREVTRSSWAGIRLSEASSAGLLIGGEVVATFSIGSVSEAESRFKILGGPASFGDISEDGRVVVLGRTGGFIYVIDAKLRTILWTSWPMVLNRSDIRITASGQKVVMIGIENGNSLCGFELPLAALLSARDSLLRDPDLVYRALGYKRGGREAPLLEDEKH